MTETQEKYLGLQMQLKIAIENTDRESAVEMTRAALAEGIPPLELFRDVIEPVLKEIGDAFSRLEMFLPDLMRAGEVVKAVHVRVLEPAIAAEGSASTSAGKIVIGTCQGDIHDIGKNMVALMLQVNGFKVVDLGTNVTPQGFLDGARREGANIIAMSSLLSPSMPYMKDLVSRLIALGERERFMLIAGGAPVTRTWAEASGLDGFGEDAIEAVSVCQDLMRRQMEKKR